MAGEGKEGAEAVDVDGIPLYTIEDLLKVAVDDLPPTRIKDEGKIKKESTAQVVAIGLVLGFLILLTLPFWYLGTAPKPDVNATAAVVSQTVDLIKTIAAVLSGLVGAVLVYYFGVEKGAGPAQ